MDNANWANSPTYFLEKFCFDLLARIWYSCTRREATTKIVVGSVSATSQGGDRRNVSLLKHLILLILAIFCFPAAAFADWGDDQYALAADHYRNQRWQQAITEFQSLIEREPNHARTPVAHFFMGESFIQLQDYSKCVDHFSHFVDNTQQHPLKTRALFRRAEANYLVGNDAAAIDQLQQLLKNDSAKIYFEYALVYLGEMNQRLPDAEHQQAARDYFEQALAKYPTSALSNRCRLGLAQVFQSAGQYKEADRFLAFLIDAKDEAILDEAIVCRASVLIELENWDAAKSLLSDAQLAKLPLQLRAKAEYWLGRAELGLSQWEPAVLHLQKAYADLKNDSLAEAAAYDCAIALWQSGKMDNAQQLLRESIERWPAGKWVAEARFLRVQAALETGDTTEVQNRVNEFASHHSGHPLWPRVLEAEGRAAFARADYSQATTSFKKLIALNQPKDNANDEQAQWRPTWYYMLGVSQIAKSDYVDGLKSTEFCLELLRSVNAGDLENHCQFARCTALFKLKRFEDALAAQEQWLAKFGHSPLRNEILTDRLQSLIALEKWEQCEQQLEWIKPLMQDEAPATINRRNSLALSSLKIAQRHFEAGEIENATIWFQQAVRAADEQLKQQAESGLAWTAFRSADSEKRDEAFDVLMSRYPDSELSANAALKQAESLANNGQTVEAKKILRKLADRDDQWPNKHLALGLLAKLTATENSKASQRSGARLLKEAIRHCESQKMEGAPLDSYLYDLAWLQLELGESSESILRFRQINITFPHSRFWADASFRVAQNYFDQGKNQLAKDMLEQILDRKQKSDPNGLVTDQLLAHVYYLQAMISVKEENWNAVRQYTKQLCNEFPDNSLRWNAEYWQAEAQYRAGEYLAAVAAMRIVTERTAGRLDTWVAMAHLRLAQSLGQRGQWAEALAAAEQAKKNFPDFRQTFELDYLMGRAYAQDARFADARAAYQQVIDSPQGSRTETAAMAQWMIGETYFHQEEYSLAAQAYHRTETLYRFPQWQAAALLQAGKCYEHLSQEADAISVYRQLVREYPEHVLAQQGQERLDRLVERRNLTATGNRNRNR